MTLSLFEVAEVFKCTSTEIVHLRAWNGVESLAPPYEQMPENRLLIEVNRVQAGKGAG